MPYISINVSQKLTCEQKTELAHAVSQAVTCFSGKPRPEVSMVDIEDGKAMFFGDTPLERGAYVNIGLHGTYSYEEKDAYTARVSEVLYEQLGIENTAVYLTVSEYEIWGVRGTQMKPKN